MESYHKSEPRIIRATAAAPRLVLVEPGEAVELIISALLRPEINVDAIGSPAIATTCHLCGGSFSDRDLQELEWPLLDSPAHRLCYLEHCEAYDRWNREEMRGA